MTPPPHTTAAEALEAIYAAVVAIPRGSVATYGQVAEVAGLPRRARMVGHALKNLPDDSDIPWHRVINAGGRVSPRRGRRGGELDQKQLLEAEGVVFDGAGRIDLSVYRWDPDG